MLDVHSDPEHHRSVLTLGGTLETVEEAARRCRRARRWPASISGPMPGSTPGWARPTSCRSSPCRVWPRRPGREFARRPSPPARRARREEPFRRVGGGRVGASLLPLRTGAFAPRRPPRRIPSLDSGCRAVDAPSDGGEHRGRRPAGARRLQRVDRRQRRCGHRRRTGSRPVGGPLAGRRAAGPERAQPGPARRGGRPGQLQPDRPGFRLRGRRLRRGGGRGRVGGLLGAQGRARRAGTGRRPRAGAAPPLAGTRPGRGPDHRGPRIGGRRRVGRRRAGRPRPVPAQEALPMARRCMAR